MLQCNVSFVTIRPAKEPQGQGDQLPAGLRQDFRDFIPMLVLGNFCGLRPERELGEMEDMSDIDLEDKGE